MSVKNELDQYYTNPEYALTCFESAISFVSDKNKMIEPCAGAGAFYNLMPEGSIGLDLEPVSGVSGVVQQDFLEYDKDLRGFSCITNPPFGKNASLAVKFFNQLGKLGVDLIAMVVPKTFKKQSIHNRLDENFKLISSVDSPKNSFILDGNEYDVPCCFQIWVRSSTKRQKVNVNVSDNEYIEFVGVNDDFDVAVRRAGSRAGKRVYEYPESGQGVYFIKIKKDFDRILNIINNAEAPESSGDTAGVKSVSKYEYIKHLGI